MSNRLIIVVATTFMGWRVHSGRDSSHDSRKSLTTGIRIIRPTERDCPSPNIDSSEVKRKMRFNIDSPFWQFLTLCVRYFILNLLFVISCLPVVTIGPARAALYSTVFAYNDNEDVNLGREYIRRFIHEFPRALGAFAKFIALAALIVFALAFWNHLGTKAAWVVLPILIAAGILVAVTFEYYFPIQARFTNTFRNTWSNALKMPWAVFGKTLILLAIDVAAITLFVFTKWLRILFVLLGFSWLAYAKSLVYLKAFDQIERVSRGEAGDGSTSNPFTPENHSLPTASLT